jgi:mono/diheme cytochrome c family protein
MILRTSASIALAVVIAVIMSGCASLDLNTIAPPVTASPQLERGRLIYVTKCATCHAPEPVRKYSAAKWEKIIPDMAEDTKLNEQDVAAVAAYVRWALQQPTTSPPSR